MKNNLFTLLLTASLCLPLSAAAQGSASAPDSGILVQQPWPSPDGLEVVFAADFDGPINLWTVRTNGLNLRKLTYNSGTDEEPTWSPNGKSIAYASTSPSSTDIFTVGPTGLSKLQLTSGSLNNRQPAWSKDSSKIAFVSDRGGTNDIWVMNADGTGQTRVTSLTGQENHPSFSPNGTKIVFSETDSSNHAALYIVNVDGTGLTLLTPANSCDWNPVWTAQGIYFSSNRGNLIDHWKIWTVQPNGTGLAQVGNTAAVDPVPLPGGGFLFSDEFSSLASDSVLSEVTQTSSNSGPKQLLTNVTTPFVQSSIALSISPNASLTAGQPLTVTAIVTPLSGTAIPSGTVTFSLPVTGSPVEVVTLDHTGKATFQATVPPAGTYSLVATYNGSPVFSGSQSAIITRAVTKP